MSENDLGEKIYQIVSNSSGIKAKDIARLLHEEKKIINSLLHKLKKDEPLRRYVYDTKPRSSQAMTAQETNLHARVIEMTECFLLDIIRCVSSRIVSWLCFVLSCFYLPKLSVG